jgi:hypothetical protein
VLLLPLLPLALLPLALLPLVAPELTGPEPELELAPPLPVEVLLPPPHAAATAENERVNNAKESLWDAFMVTSLRRILQFSVG